LLFVFGDYVGAGNAFEEIAGLPAFEDFASLADGLRLSRYRLDRTAAKRANGRRRPARARRYLSDAMRTPHNSTDSFPYLNQTQVLPGKSESEQEQFRENWQFSPPLSDKHFIQRLGCRKIFPKLILKLSAGFGFVPRAGSVMFS
jgi:hypothetical protein